MRFHFDKEYAHVVLDADEDEREVLRAIVKASFELAGPVALSAIDYIAEQRLNEAEVDQCIREIPRSHDLRVVDIDFVKGRQCKTVVSRQTSNHFLLDARLFERYRGTCIPMLERAQALAHTYKTVDVENSAEGDVKTMAAGKY